MKKLTRPEIQEILKREGISQIELAAAARISRSHLSHVLSGRDKSQLIIDMLSNLLGEPIEIVPIYQPNYEKRNRKVVELRKRLFTPTPSTELAEPVSPDA